MLSWFKLNLQKRRRIHLYTFCAIFYTTCNTTAGQVFPSPGVIHFYSGSDEASFVT